MRTTKLLIAAFALSGVVAQASEHITYRVPEKYPTIQEAVDAVPVPVPGEANDVIHRISIAPGNYEETVFIRRNCARIVLVGDGGGDRSKVVLRAGPSHDPLTIHGNDVTIRNLTICQEASAEEAAQQAIVVSGKRVFFDNTDIIGNQDTVSLWDRALVYLRNSQISGTGDFIYGGGTAYFDNCTIVHRFRPAYPDLGGLTCAPGTLPTKRFGLVFYRSIITRAAGVPDSSANFYRMWNPQGRSAGSAALIDCKLDRHLGPIAWVDWDSETENYDNPDVPYRAYEIGSQDMNGHALDVSHRPVWVHQKFSRADFSRNRVLHGWVPPGT